MAARREQLFGVARLDPTATMTRLDLDVDPDFHRDLDETCD